MPDQNVAALTAPDLDRVTYALEVANLEDTDYDEQQMRDLVSFLRQQSKNVEDGHLLIVGLTPEALAEIRTALGQRALHLRDENQERHARFVDGIDGALEEAGVEPPTQVLTEPDNDPLVRISATFEIIGGILAEGVDLARAALVTADPEVGERIKKMEAENARPIPRRRS